MRRIDVRQTILIVTFLATMCASAQAQNDQQLEKWCHDENATDDQTIQGCSAVITSGRETGKKRAGLFYNRGLALLNKSQFGPAIEDFDRAIELDGNDADAFNARGDAHRLNNDPFRAIADYDKAIELKPDHVIAFKNRGMVYADVSQFLRAIEDYDQAIKLDPGRCRHLQQSRQRPCQREGVRPRAKGLRPGAQAQAELCLRLQQPRHRLRQSGPDRPRDRRLRSGDRARPGLRRSPQQSRHRRPQSRPARCRPGRLQQRAADRSEESLVAVRSRRRQAPAGRHGGRRCRYRRGQGDQCRRHRRHGGGGRAALTFVAMPGHESTVLSGPYRPDL